MTTPIYHTDLIIIARCRVSTQYYYIIVMMKHFLNLTLAHRFGILEFFSLMKKMFWSNVNQIYQKITANGA